MFSKSKHPVVHSETFSFGARKIEVKCTCPIARNHTHEEWLRVFAGVAV